MLFSVLLIVIATFTVISAQYVEDARAQERLANNIVQSASDLSFLSSEFIIHRESQYLSRWQSEFTAFSNYVANLSLVNPAVEDLAGELQESQQRMKEVFDGITSGIGTSGQSQNENETLAWVQDSWSSMAIQTRVLVSDSTRLSLVLHGEVERLNLTSFVLISAMIGAFLLLLVSVYFQTFRRTLKSISKLRNGTAIIGAGDLDYVVEENSNDEVGELSKAFNQMTTNLKTVTASKVELEKEISERKKAEAEIASLAKFPSENPAAVFRADDRGTLLYANPSAQELLETWHAKVGQPLPEHIAQIVAEALASGNKVEFEEKSGEETFSFLMAPIVAEGYANLYARRTTKRKRAEEALKQAKLELEAYSKNLELQIEERTKKLESSALYTRSLIEASLDPLVTISAEGKISDVNKATETVTGCSREELIGSDFSNYFTEPEKAATGYKKVFAEGFVTDYPLAIKHKSGRITEVLYNAAVYLNETGEIQGVFAAARDITVRKELEKQLKDSERLAAIGATAGMVGHDIRNPLQSITGDIYLAKGDLAALPDSPEKASIKESLDEIEKGLDYVNKIVADLQDYAKPITPAPKKTNVKALILDLLEKNRVPKNIKIKSRVSDEVSELLVDPDCLKRVIGNLVSNAVQAMPNGGKLVVNASKDGEAAIFSVQDTGVGIPEDVKPRLFTPLFTTKSKGQGFGLSVVKRMAEALGGSVTFESEVGKGTKFIVRLPPPRK
jgi:PAS domain S-box-containing protein